MSSERSTNACLLFILYFTVPYTLLNLFLIKILTVALSQ